MAQKTRARAGRSAPQPGPDQSGRGILVMATMVFGLFLVGAIWTFLHKADSPKNKAEMPAPEVKSPKRPNRIPTRLTQTTMTRTAALPAQNDVANTQPRVTPSAGAEPVQPAPLPEPTPQTRQLVTSLSSLGQHSGPMTPEQANEWKQNLQGLVQQGAVAVPAIREFLDKNMDWRFGSKDSQLLGYGSARRAMFDALVQIGGPEGVAATLHTLQSTADPREIALLGQNLEKLAPGEHRQEAMQAAQEVLSMTANGNLKLEGTDVAPLFEVLQKYGDAGAVPVLEQASKQWKYYATMALAQLPDGVGIPSLIQMAQRQDLASIAGVDPALRMLAQVSVQYPEARGALLEQARLNKIPPSTWPAIAPILAGDRVGFVESGFDEAPRLATKNELKSTHIAFGNQNFYSLPEAGNVTAEQTDQRLALIDQLLTVAPNPVAAQALEQSRGLLVKRSSQAVAASSPGK